MNFKNNVQTIEIKAYDYGIDISEDFPKYHQGRRYVDFKKGWDEFKEKAPTLIKETCEYWKWFEGDNIKYDVDFDESKKVCHIKITGVPNFKVWTSNNNETESEFVKNWRESIDFCIYEKGTHEQFNSGILYFNEKEYKKYDFDIPKKSNKIIIQIKLV
jgi:hypothetical protein